MFKVLRDAWRIPDIRKKILFTILMLGVYRLGCNIPIPGIDVQAVQSYLEANPNAIYEFLSLFSGGVKNMSLFFLGIMPYINASIIMQLLTVAIPALERMQKEGENGQKKIASITRYVGVGLGLVMSAGIVFSLIALIGQESLLYNSWFSYVAIILCMTAGTALIMWIGEKITDKGIGNGISLLIFISIVSKVPDVAIDLFMSNFNAERWWVIVLLLVFVVAIIGAVTFIDLGERRIPIQYAKRVVGRKMYGGQSTYIPMKVNSSGVMPLIFASTIISAPSLIVQFAGWTGTPFGDFVKNYFSLQGSSVTGFLIFALLILFFAFFYTSISFNPVDISKNIQQNGGFIPGIRPGKPTSDFLKKILNRVTLAGAIFLALIATIPQVFATGLLGASNAFGATSVLIVVNVALETTKQLESQMLMRHYKGFLG